MIKLEKHLMEKAFEGRRILSKLSLLPWQNKCFQHMLDFYHNVNVGRDLQLLEHLVWQFLVDMLPPMLR